MSSFETSTGLIASDENISTIDAQLSVDLSDIKSNLTLKSNEELEEVEKLLDYLASNVAPVSASAVLIDSLEPEPAVVNKSDESALSTEVEHYFENENTSNDIESDLNNTMIKSLDDQVETEPSLLKTSEVDTNLTTVTHIEPEDETVEAKEAEEDYEPLYEVKSEDSLEEYLTQFKALNKDNIVPTPYAFTKEADESEVALDSKAGSDYEEPSPLLDIEVFKSTLEDSTAFTTEAEEEEDEVDRLKERKSKHSKKPSLESSDSALELLQRSQTKWLVYPINIRSPHLRFLLSISKCLESRRNPPNRI